LIILINLITADSILAVEKPMAAPEGTGKKKRKKKKTINADIWAGYSKPE